MSDNQNWPLSVSRAHSVEEPFRGDLFERKAIADRLTELVLRLPDGGVIAIDAGWGEGKSWFARNWNAALASNGFPTVYLDAFEADYVDDPFLLITAELLGVMQNESEEKADTVREGAKKVAAVVMPIVAKAAARAISVAVTGIDVPKRIDSVMDALAESIGDQAGERVSEAIEARIDELQVRRKSVESFRASLTDALSTSSKPLVFLVDELDRCKPPFAVALLERIKHFFAVPRLVFVLLLNKAQLEASVRGIYGADIDSGTYLSKFLTLSLTLPARLSEESRKSEFAHRYCLELGRRFGYSQRRGFDEFAETLSGLAPLFGMSFREVERAFSYYGLVGRAESTASLIAYFCALRVSKPELFHLLVRGTSKSSHESVAKFVWEILTAHPKRLPWILPVVHAAHLSQCVPADKLTDESKQKLAEFQQAFRSHHGVDATLSYWARQLDLQVP